MFMIRRPMDQALRRIRMNSQECDQGVEKIKRNKLIVLTGQRRVPRSRRHYLPPLCLAAVLISLLTISAFAQSQTETPTPSSQELFHLERVPVAGGAELLTIQAKVENGDSSDPRWIPLVTVLRDTLGDEISENDRLRYLWALTYTRPTFWQRVSGAVPFLYTRVGSKQSASRNPPPLMDLAAADRDVWNKICWQALQTILLDPYGTPLRASTRAYQRNISDYRKSHMIRALSLLTLYQELGHQQIFSDAELKEIQARLLLSDKTFGGFVDELKLPAYYQKENTKIKDDRGQNWELLRQQAEANGLYFEPLEMPDGSATHVLLWVAKSEIGTRTSERFDGRFLNIANPWTDKRLRQWTGYAETRSFDNDHRPVDADRPGATEVELIPLGLYGLDHPKIPALLVDFRDARNPKRREMSRRVLQDVTKNILAVSRFGDLPFFLGRSVFDFVTGRRGLDINQPSRLKAYSQLKLLLSLDSSLEPELRSEITNRLEAVSLNPLENDVEAERKLARQQYEALLAYAARPDGLPARLARDRRAEMTQLEHHQAARIFFRLANVVSFGTYTHRENDDANIPGRLDIARQRAYHTRILREVAQSGMARGGRSEDEAAPKIEVTWNLDQVRNSLRFMAEHGTVSDRKAVVAAARIFARTNDDETRLACLETLSRIRNDRARVELVRISERKDLDQGWRDLSAQYLGNAPRIVTPANSAGNVGMTGNPH
jgi:hypothetical protein